MSNNNQGWCKTAKLKKLVVKKGFTAFVISDELKYLIFENKPVLGGVDRNGNVVGYGKFYDFFLNNGFRIKGIQLKNKIIEQKLGNGGFGESNNHRVQAELMSRCELAGKGQAWMQVKDVFVKKINFSDQLILIKSKQDIINLQKSCVNENIGWVLIKRLVLEHVESGREILNTLNEVKKLENVHTQQLYTSHIQKSNGVIAPIYKFTPNQLAFLMEGDCHNIYDYCCKRALVAKPQELVATSCQGQGLFFDNL